MARGRLTSAEKASPAPEHSYQTAQQVLQSGGPFIPFCTFSILDWYKHTSSSSATSVAPPVFSKWLADRLQEGRPIMLRDFDKLDEWDPRTFNLESLIELSTNKPISIRSCENGRGQNCTLRSYVDAMQSSSRGIPNLYARDLPCPQKWMELCSKVIPAELQWGGPMDLFQWLPQYARSEVMMAYIGSKGSHSGFHRCFGATVALNLLIEAQDNVLCFGTDHASQTKYDAFMESRGISSHTDWANMSPDELRSANFPIYIQEQTVGDLVIFPPATAHQVWNIGSASAKLVWNILHPLSVEVGIDYVQPSYNRLCHPDIARTNLSLACAALSLISRDSLRTLPPELPLLMRLFRRLVDEETIDGQPATPIKLVCLPYASVAECNYCGTAIWNRHVQCSKCKDFDVCLTCFVGGRSCEHTSSYVWAEIVPVETLELAMSQAREALGSMPKSSVKESEKELSLGTCVDQQLKSRASGQSRLCHLCRTEHPEWKGRQCQTCSTYFCFRGLYRHFELLPQKVIKHPNPWSCPKCREICNCRCCHFQSPHVARPKPPRKQRVASVDTRGKTLGFMDNVFDKKRQSEHLGVLSTGNKRASSTLILPSTEKRGQKRTLPSLERSETSSQVDMDRNVREEVQIRPNMDIKLPSLGSIQEISNGGLIASKTPDLSNGMRTTIVETLKEPLKRNGLNRSITERDPIINQPRKLARTPSYGYFHSEADSASPIQAGSKPTSSELAKSEDRALASDPTVSQLERKIEQLRSYADELLELSLHDSHCLLMERLSNLENELRFRKAAKSNELIEKLESDFPALAEVTKREMERLGYLT